MLESFKLNDSKFNEKFITDYFIERDYFMNKNEQTRYKNFFKELKLALIRFIKDYFVDKDYFMDKK